MLRRIYELQRAAHGPNDPRCFSTLQKLLTIRGQQKGDANQRSRRHRPSGDEETKSSRPEQPEPSVEAKTESEQADEEGTSSSRCTPVPTGNAATGSGGGKGGLFKAIRSLGRKKTT